ncbi:MAG: tetratricopeptide repeat protein, partial [Bacteroidetes bacterium]|nr:tetratricopeptide repeat protein [Bacteroidota bacterium]
NTGRIYMDKGEFDSSLKHFLVALTNAQLKHDSVNLMYVNLNIGTLYQRMGKYDEALGSYLKSLAISQLINNTKGMALAYSIGIIYKERGDYQTALHYYTMAIPACKKLGELDDLANIYSNMSNVYMLMKRFDDATNILRKSIAVSDSAGNQRQLGIAYANMGKTKELMHQYDSATYYLNLSLDIFKKSGFLNLESIVLRMISEAYEARGDYKNAFNYHKKHTTIADSIHSEKVEKQIAELRLKYETENKETENNLLKKDIEFEKGKSYYLLVITIILLLSGIISLFLFYFIRKNTITKKQLAESEASRLKAKLESQKRELTLGALSVSRNLEFINSLIDELKELTNYVSEDGLQPLSNIVSKLTHQQSDNGWKEFEKRFSEIHSDFYSRLIIEYPDLTQNEVKLSAFLKLGMNTKEICSITFQSVRAVEAARLRLRKKLSLKNGENLSIFLQSY